MQTIHLKHNLPHTLSTIPHSVTDKRHRHRLHGLVDYAKYHFIDNYRNTCTYSSCYALHLSVSLSVCLRLGGHINRMSNLRLRKRIYGELQAALGAT